MGKVFKMSDTALREWIDVDVERETNLKFHNYSK